MEKTIPYKKARDIISRNREHITVLDCPCRVARKNPCTPLEVCLVMGEVLASFMLENHPTKSRSISPEEALGLLAAEHKRGHVHHAFFKEAVLDRFYAICNCCSCCCGAIQAMRNGNPMLASSGFVAKVDEQLCMNCGLCISSCQFNAILRHDGEMVTEEATCMGCGVCEDAYMKGAGTMVEAPERGTPLEVHTLIEETENGKHNHEREAV